MSNVIPFGTTFLPYLEVKFHLKQHFPSYIYGERQYTTIHQYSNQQNSSVRHFSTFFVVCPVIIQKNAVVMISADTEDFISSAF